MCWVGGHCLSCREGDSEQGLQLGKGGTLPEGQGGLFHQISQAFQLRPKGREMYFSFPTRQVSMVGPLRIASLFPTRLLCLSPPAYSSPPLPPESRLQTPFWVTMCSFGELLTVWANICIWTSLQLPQRTFLSLLLSPADPASVALPGETFTI